MNAVGGGTGSSSNNIKAKVIEDMYSMSGHLILLALVLVCVYVSRIPDSILNKFKSMYYKIAFLFIIIILTTSYGILHGILAGLAFALVISRAQRHSSEKEQFMTYIPALLFGDSDGTTIVDTSHRWLSEEILNLTPKLIRDKEVSTSAVQDMGDQNMKSSHSSR
jgi:predicted membrane protein